MIGYDSYFFNGVTRCNRNTSSHFPKLVPLSSFPFSAILNYQVGYRCTRVPRLPFPVTRYQFY